MDKVFDFKSYSGKKQKIAVVDSGVDITHPIIRNKVKGGISIQFEVML